MAKYLILLALLSLQAYGQCVLGLNPKTKQLECVGGAVVSGGAVGGASNLTTVGAVPYVVSAGVLGLDASRLQYIPGANNSLNIVGNSSSLLFFNGTASGIGTTGITGLRIQTNSLDRVYITPSTGNVIVVGSTFTDGNYKLDVQASGSTGTLRAFNQAVGGTTLVVVQAGDTQGSNLQSWRNNVGGEIAYVNSGGSFASTGVFTFGSNLIGSTTNGYFSFVSNGVVRLTNDAATDFNRLQFGGTTSSFPALKRSSATLQVRLADDSAFTTIQASNYISNDGSTGITGATCSSFKNGICVAP